MTSTSGKPRVCRLNRLHAVQGLEDVAVLHTELEAQGAGFVLEGAAQGVAVDFHRQGDLEYQQGALFFLRHESLEVFENIAYIMAKHADPENVPDSPDDFLERFNTFSIYEILPQLIELWGLNTATQVESKKNIARLTGR